jgi:glycogen(starch) synthase
MKILHFIYDHTGNPWVGGGGAVRAYELNRRLAERHDITIICGKYPGANDYDEGNLKIRFVGTQRNNYILSTFSYAFHAALFLKKHREMADLVIEDYAPYNPIFSKHLASCPSVIQVHHREGTNLFKRYFILGLPFMFVEQFYPGSFSDAITVSEASRTKFGLQNAVVIPNGIDSALLETVPSDGKYIAFLGRIQIHNKGLDTLIDALTLTDAAVALAGRGRDEERLTVLAKNKKVIEKIDLRGHLSEQEKADFLSRSKFLVLPSRYEGQGIVLLEAAACRKPVIVSDIPELRFAVEAGFGMSFRTGDAKDLAEKMDMLSKDEILRKEMGQKGREYAKAFTWDNIAEKYEDYLTQVQRSGFNVQRS